VNNKKNIVAKLAGVTMLATSALGAAAPMTGLVQGVVSSAQEVSNVELTGTMKLSGNEMNNWGHRDTWQIDAKVKQRVKEGDTITFKAKGVDVSGLNNSEIKLKDGTVIGKIVIKSYPYSYYYEVNGKKYYYWGDDDKWNNENSALYNQDLTKLNDGQKNLKPDTQFITDFEIVFNKKAEEFNTLDFSMGQTNIRSSTILSNKAQDVTYSIESGGKTIAKNSFQLKEGVKLAKQLPFNFLDGNGLSNVQNTESGLSNGNLFYGIDPSPTEPLRKGNRIVVESKSDSNFKFDSENDKLKVGSIMKISHGRGATEGDMIANEHGAYITKLNQLEAKIVESTPDKVVLEVMNDNYTEGVTLNLPIKVTSFEGYNKEQNTINGLKYYISTETNDPRTTKSASGPVTLQVEGANVGASGVKIQYKTTQWVDEATKKSIKNSKIAETVEPAGTIDGYTFVRTNTDSKTGSVTHFFKKNQVKKAEDDVKVTTKWIDEATKESLTKAVTGDKPAEPGTIKGYTFVRTEHPTENEYIHVFKKNEEPKKVVTRFVDEDGHVIKEKPGTVEKEEIPDYTYVRTEKDKDGNTIHHYNSVKTIHKDENGNVIKTEKGKKPADKIPGYTFVKTEVGKDGNTVHTYHKIVTKFVNVKDGKEIILKSKDGEQPKEDLPGYTFVETKKDPKNGDVTHFYKDNDPAPIETLTIFKDENGNVIKTEKGKKDPDKIPGYTFVKTEVDKDGNTVHTYHKIVTKFITFKDGKEFVLKTKDGDQPKEDIDGYDFEKTEKDEKTGDVIHLYKAKAKVADKKEAVKTGASAGQFILPLVGLGGLGGLITFAARRKAKRKG
jgi:surface repeat SSSPR-51 protein